MERAHITKHYISEDHFEKIIGVVELAESEARKLDAIGWASSDLGMAIRAKRRQFRAQADLLVQHLPVAIGKSILDAAAREAVEI